MYLLNEEEKAALRQKMDAYVQELWETDLAECVERYQIELEDEKAAQEQTPGLG